MLKKFTVFLCFLIFSQSNFALDEDLQRVTQTSINKALILWNDWGLMRSVEFEALNSLRQNNNYKGKYMGPTYKNYDEYKSKYTRQMINRNPFLKRYTSTQRGWYFNHQRRQIVRQMNKVYMDIIAYSPSSIIFNFWAQEANTMWQYVSEREYNWLIKTNHWGKLPSLEVLQNRKTPQFYLG